jgi:hypothetical protein
MATIDWKKIAAPINRTFYQSNKTKQKIVMKKSLSKGYIIFTDGKIIKSFKIKKDGMIFLKKYMSKN